MKKAAFIFLLLLVSFGSLYFYSRRNLHANLLGKGCYARIPVEFIGNNPLVKVEINGKMYPVKLDLGAACQFAFFKEALDDMSEKKFIEFLTTTDVKGNQYQVSSYSVPWIKSKNLECKDAIILEESRDFVAKGAKLWQSDDKKDFQVPFVGRIGRDCFRTNHLFLDFPNSMIFVTSSMNQLKMDHWSICDLFETSFEMGRWGIILSIETDIGTRRLILDTGASASILKKSSLNLSSTKEETPGRQMFTTTKFVIGGHDFGPVDLSLFEIASSIDADGFIGLDFLKKYAIYLDFEDCKVFIGPSSEVCGAIIF